MCAGGAGASGRRARTRAALRALRARYSVPWPEQDLVDDLFVDSGDGTGWLTGVSEISVSLHAERPVTVRCLSEIIQRRRLEPELARVGLDWGTDLLQRLSSLTGMPYATALFRDVYRSVYSHAGDQPSAPLFRFGMAVELGDAAPIAKAYFDLHAASGDPGRIVGRVARLLGDGSGLDRWRSACPGIDLGQSRVVGVDLGAGGAVRARFYWGARDLTWDGLARATREISGARHLVTLERLIREVCPSSEALSAVMVSMVSSSGARCIKLDVCLPQLFRNDGDAYTAIERFRGPDLDGHGPSPFEEVTGGLAPGQTRRIQQYLGVEMLPDTAPRVNIYYRPIGFETEHMRARLRPELCA